jgi:hypothetical protein
MVNGDGSSLSPRLKPVLLSGVSQQALTRARRYQDPYMEWDRAELRRWLVQWKLFYPQKYMGIEVVRPCILLDGSCQQPWQEQTGEHTEAPHYLTPKKGQPIKLVFSDTAKVFCPPGALRTNKKNKVTTKNKNLFQATGWNLIKNKMVDEKKKGWGKLALDLKGEIDRVHADKEVGGGILHQHSR